MDITPPSYPFSSYIDGQKVSVVIKNIKIDVSYTFTVSAGNKYGTSEFVITTWIGIGEGVCDVLCLP